MGTIAFIKELIPLVFMAVNGFVELLPVIREGFDRVSKAAEEGRDMSQEDWDWLNVKIAEKRTQVREKLSR